MGGLVKKASLIFMIFGALLLSACGDVYQASNEEVESVHSIFDTFEGFTDEITCITSAGLITATSESGIYNLQIANDNLDEYSYNTANDTLYKNETVIEENIELNTLDAFATKVVLIANPDDYCVSINVFADLIKKSFANATNMKKSSNRGEFVYCTVEIEGSSLLAENEAFLAIKKIDKDFTLSNSEKVSLSLLVSKDLSKVFPDFSISINNNNCVSFTY